MSRLPEKNRRYSGLRHWLLPVVVAVTGIILTAITTSHIINAARQEADRLAARDLSCMAQTVRIELQDDIDALNRMAARSAVPGTENAFWREDARNYLRDSQGYHALALMDEQGRVFQLAARDDSPDFWSRLQLDIETLEFSGNASFQVLRPKGIHGFLLFVFPLRNAGAGKGYLLAAYDLESGLAGAFPHVDEQPFFIEIIDQDGIIYSGIPAQEGSWYTERQTDINLYGLDWRMRQVGGSPSYDQRLVALVFMSGAGLSLLLACIILSLIRQREIREKTEFYRSRLESIMDNIVDGLLTIDEGGIIQTYNKACEKIFGYKAEEVIGRNIKLLMPESHARQHDQYISDYIHTGRPKIIGIGRELEGLRKDGSTFPLDLSVAEIKVGNKRLFSGIVRDITERKRAEAQLMRSNQELETFAYVASHDLKEPLRNIDNLAQWVLEDNRDALPSAAQEKLGLLRERVRRLDVLLDDILSYSRAGRIVEPALPVDVNDLVDHLAKTRVPEGFVVRIEGALPTLISSRTPLEQIFANLLSNAVKHHDKAEGSIVISASRQDGFYQFTVRDDGPGIPPAYHERLFQMFQTLESRDVVAGSGLGMSIVKKLVEWQGGRVWIESIQGRRGTAIHFLWPRHIDTEEKAA